MERINYPGGSKWESFVGYSRAVRIGDTIEISGTVAADNNTVPVWSGNAYEQTKYIIRKIEQILEQSEASLDDIVRTRMFVTDISKWEEYGRAHGEFFSDIRPCTSMLEVKALISPEYLIEIEVTAVLTRKQIT